MIIGTDRRITVGRTTLLMLRRCAYIAAIGARAFNRLLWTLGVGDSRTLERYSIALVGHGTRGRTMVLVNSSRWRKWNL
jgi:hypothetical protein